MADTEYVTTTLSALSPVALAVEETVTTPMPGLGHGKLADLVAVVTWVALALRVVG